MDLDFFNLEIGGQKISLLSCALAELELMNFERLITEDEEKEMEAILNYDLSSQIQIGISYTLIEKSLFTVQIEYLIKLIESYGGIL